MVFYAHREGRRFYLLSAHLASVAAGAAGRVAAVPGRGELVTAAFLAGLGHDFGKYTGYFQQYLRTGRGGPEKQHAFISGLWVNHLAARLELPASQRLALFLAVIRHHQELWTPEEYLVRPRDLDSAEWEALDPVVCERLRAVEKQVEDLRSRVGPVSASLRCAARRASRLLATAGQAAPAAVLRLNWGALLDNFLADWRTTYGELYKAWRRQKKDRPEAHHLEAYFELLTLFSALIDADKIHAARILGAAPSAALPPEAVDRYREARFAPPRRPLETLREELYQSVLARVSEVPLTQRILTLTAPTGAGKTLAGLAAAFRLRERLAAPGRRPARIIYALPFTSIVDQTFAVAADLLRTALLAPGASVPSPWLLKHHHLAELAYRDDQGSERSLDEALLLVESWQSEVIITTFVQLFHTLVGYENRMLKKFHRLGGAVLILDEVQNIPVEYWPLVEETLRQACGYLDMRVILMTATRPEWFRPGEALELAGEEEAVRRRFQAVNRVTILPYTGACTVEEAAAAFLEEYRDDRSYLVILNTIKSSIAFYQALREAWRQSGPPLYYLSTNIVPAERERRLKEIGECLTRGGKPVLVSTQVVEAGIDLDFAEVWRDLGPVDAVVQAAGRCNRHFMREQGRVRLMQLVDKPDEGGRALASFVYGKIHTLAAKRLFAGRSSLAELEFYDLVADYFRIVREAKSFQQSEKLLDAMTHLRFKAKTSGEEEKSVSDFALIVGRPNYVDVFVCVDEDAAQTWDRYRATVLEERDLRRRHEAYLKLKRDFCRYLVSVPRELLVHRLSGESRPLMIPGYLLEEFYDPETGFKRAQEETAIIF